MSNRIRISPCETTDTGMYIGIENGKEMCKKNPTIFTHLRFPFTVWIWTYDLKELRKPSTFIQIPSSPISCLHYSNVYKNIT